jgi:hypothetical protein
VRQTWAELNREMMKPNLDWGNRKFPGRIDVDTVTQIRSCLWRMFHGRGRPIPPMRCCCGWHVVEHLGLVRRRYLEIFKSFIASAVGRDRNSLVTVKREPRSEEPTATRSP